MYVSFILGMQAPSYEREVQFIAGKMREVDVWKFASEAEFDNAMEGMEKLVMNRLYELYVGSVSQSVRSMTYWV